MRGIAPSQIARLVDEVGKLVITYPQDRDRLSGLGSKLWAALQILSSSRMAGLLQHHLGLLAQPIIKQPWFASPTKASPGRFSGLAFGWTHAQKDTWLWGSKLQTAKSM